MEGSPPPASGDTAQAMRDRIEARNNASRKRASQARLYTSTPPTTTPASSTQPLAPSHSISKWNRSPAATSDVLDSVTLDKLFISVASATNVGKRSYMEDRVAAVTFDHPTTLEPLAFVAVFDGHGGTHCANFLQHGLHTHVKHHLAAHRRSFHDAPHESLESAFQLACRDADNAFLGSHLADDSGSCAVFALVGKDKWVGNVGDSQAILSRYGRAIDLCVAHTPQHPDERARILAANGQIVQDRYIFGYLGVSRSFGDRFVKVERPVVITTPDVVSGGHRHNHPGDEFLLLACDGLFEVFTPQEAVDFVTHHKTVNQMAPQAICDLLVRTAIENGSQDNVSVVLVMLQSA
ncbi:hypothetical protein, variant 1 [Aphanomyces invadans]|uniref:PPM-type phosphatase domain-containing protein n=1 Tax=Aphanomyces invadans TaxID=157072 RepID=A0A024TKW5_9STRA|nr:hypothetical protein, variant 1 [Aphanomyces invadans]ETV94649.1 hypothetical protein, variant 1 [Aphanomyces invadans]|eukprot:XP_008876593.1 hypothetical protein, variant 1 [Aphanomyces invadans]